MKIRVLFICTGNICRSPMAEYILKDMVEKKGLCDSFYIESAATSSEEVWNGVGNPVYPPAKQELLAHGIGGTAYTDFSGKRARQVTKADYARFDYLVCMEDVHVSGTRRIVCGDPEGKLCKLMSFTGRDKNVADPWYSDRFDIAYRDISEGCEAMLEKLLENGAEK